MSIARVNPLLKYKELAEEFNLPKNNKKLLNFIENLITEVKKTEGNRILAWLVEISEMEAAERLKSRLFQEKYDAFNWGVCKDNPEMMKWLYKLPRHTISHLLEVKANESEYCYDLLEAILTIGVEPDEFPSGDKGDNDV